VDEEVDIDLRGDVKEKKDPNGLWRPRMMNLLMMIMFWKFILGPTYNALAPSFGFVSVPVVPLPPQFWTFATVVAGAYAAGRSAEKALPGVVKAMKRPDPVVEQRRPQPYVPEQRPNNIYVED